MISVKREGIIIDYEYLLFKNYNQWYYANNYYENSKKTSRIRVERDIVISSSRI